MEDYGLPLPNERETPSLGSSLLEEIKNMSLNEILERYDPDTVKRIIDLFYKRPPTAAYGRPRHFKAALRWALNKDSFTAEELRDYLRSIDPAVKDEKLGYTKVGILDWNYTTFSKKDGTYTLTPSAREVARLLTEGEDLTVTDLVILRGMYLSVGTKYGGPLVRVYALMTTQPEREWKRAEIMEEFKRSYMPLLNPKDPDKRTRWEVGQYLMYLVDLGLIRRVDRGVYRLEVL